MSPMLVDLTVYAVAGSFSSIKPDIRADLVESFDYALDLLVGVGGHVAGAQQSSCWAARREAAPG